MNSHGKNPRTARFVSTTLINLLIVVVAWAWTDTARAVAPVLGWGDKILHLRNLPPDLKESVHQQLHFHTAIGFHYHHCFVFGESCDLWTWGGGFVLYNDERYWQFDDDDLQRLLGKELYGSLSVPWTYRVPPALPVFAVIVVCIWLISRRKARAQQVAYEIESDARYQQALELYAESLPEDREASSSERQEAIDSGVGFLVAQGIPADQATANLNWLLQKIAHEESYELRFVGARHEQAKNWAEAIECYESAARLQAVWNPKDSEFLMTCVERCKKKQERAEF